MTDSFFTLRLGAWFEPTSFARGPCGPDASAAGSPTGVGIADGLPLDEVRPVGGTIQTVPITRVGPS